MMTCVNVIKTAFSRTCQNQTSRVTIGLVLFGLTLTVFLSADNYPVSGQMDDMFGQTSQRAFLENTSNGSNSIESPFQQLSDSQPSLGLVAEGSINSVISVPVGKWLAVGNWSLIINNGNVDTFETKMTWYNSSGTGKHSHELTNLQLVDNYEPISMENFSNVIIKGLTDVGTNGQVSWSGVPTTISFNGNKIVVISVDDNKTNHHFAGQPILGIVDRFEPCSDIPGANMEVLSPCKIENNEQVNFPSSDTTEGYYQPSNDTTMGYYPPNGFVMPEDNQPSTGQEGFQPGVGDQCMELKLKNISASGFEEDPSDYHPPSDASDGDASTWWSNKDKNSWLRLDIGEEKLICGLSVQWNKGDTREYTFEISVSKDGNDFSKVFEGTNNQGSSSAEEYKIDSASGRYVDLTFLKSSSKVGWVGVKEILVYGNPKE